MSDLHRSAKSDIELRDRAGKKVIRSMPRTRKAMTIALAAFIGAAIIAWIAVLAWGVFAAGKWMLSLFFSI